MSRNSCITDETLIGYLLFALPEAEQWRIECLENSDPELRQRIQDLRGLLEPLKLSPEVIEPRHNLTASTMKFIEQATQHADAQGASAELKMSQPIFESDRSTRFAWIDSLVTLAAGIVILSILIPSVWNSRESARRISCASNLRELGHAFSMFAHGNSDHQLPKIETSGPLSFAGVYTVRLKEAGLLDSSKWVWCPAVARLDVSNEIPTVQAYLASSPWQKQNWKYSVGGNYSYNLGNIVDGDYETPCLNGRSHFAVLGDSILPSNGDDSKGDDSRGIVHAMNAANILYEDGRVQSVRIQHKNVSAMLDNPYLNRDMEQAVGHGLDDTCLGPSFQNPFKPVSLETR